MREKALQATIDRLRNENLDYRSATKAADFERQIKVGAIAAGTLCSRHIVYTLFLFVLG